VRGSTESTACSTAPADEAEHPENDEECSEREAEEEMAPPVEAVHAWKRLCVMVVANAVRTAPPGWEWVMEEKSQESRVVGEVGASGDVKCCPVMAAGVTDRRESGRRRETASMGGR
jgi:hypothetical protein